MDTSNTPTTIETAPTFHSAFIPQPQAPIAALQRPAAELVAPEIVGVDDDFLHAEDADGNAIPDSDVIAAAERVELLTFDFAKQKHKIEVRAMQIPARLTNRLSNIGTRLALEAGYRPGDNIGGENEGEEADPRLNKLVTLTEESEELRAVQAEIAVVATVRDARGFFRTSVPQFREGLTPQKLLTSGALGDGYIKAVRDWLRPT